MESSTAAPESTGSRTIADMMGLAAERHGDRTAVTFKRGDEWAEVSYRELGEIVSEIARGLIDLGLAAGDRAAVLCSTRPEWTYSSFGISSAGGVVVPIYPTNSPEECEWVAGNSESRFVICEDAEQAAKIAQVRERLPQLEAVIVIDPSGDVGDAISLDDLRERGRGRDAAEVAERAAAVS
ncbi:MAG TPA: AMP-binding protein, partial [Solirubrobacteraceae bacterium]|nr:AMP-binding protein [Solirubrobacteraceae bacterium]